MKVNRSSHTKLVRDEEKEEVLTNFYPQFYWTAFYIRNSTTLRVLGLVKGDLVIAQDFPAPLRDNWLQSIEAQIINTRKIL